MARFQIAPRLARKSEDVAEVGRTGKVLSTRGEVRPVSGGHQTRRRIFIVRLSDPEMLGSGWRAFHHLPDGLYAEPAHGQTQLRDVPNAGVRRTDHRHALAA